MDLQTQNLPSVLVFAGHDPSGGAGIQADIESIIANGCRCVSVITALTAQNTARFNQFYPQKKSRFREQAELILADISVHACKIGLIGSIKLTQEICNILDSLTDGIPVVLDPVLVTGTGKSIADNPLIIALKKYLFRYTTVLTPNTVEARLLTGQDDIYKAAEKLLKWGCRSVLITGADEKTSKVKNILFGQNFATVHYDWERLPGVYHGSGCTLSSSIAAQLALGSDIITAVNNAQEFTWQSLKHGYQVGSKQKHPNRFFKYNS